MALNASAPAARVPAGPRRRAEDLLCRIGAYTPARNAYQRVFNAGDYAIRRRDRAFFRSFVPAGGLVFDIGANEGRMTQTFAELGAVVVAVEPDPELALRIRARYGSGRVTVEPMAVADALGVAELLLGRDRGHSTISAAWQQAVGAEASGRWHGTVEVPVTTLDALIDRHGRPDFLKIDVEGSEPQVLAGLSRPVPILSFEFLCAAVDIARACVEQIDQLGTYELNVARGEEHRLRDDGWTDSATLMRHLDTLRRQDPEGYGDVYARLTSA